MRAEQPSHPLLSQPHPQTTGAQETAQQQDAATLPRPLSGGAPFWSPVKTAGPAGVGRFAPAADCSGAAIPPASLLSPAPTSGAMPGPLAARRVPAWWSTLHLPADSMSVAQGESNEVALQSAARFPSDAAQQ